MSNSSKRIISLVPSLTELIIDLGLQEQLVGRTRFCVHPEDKIEAIPIIGGTKNPRIDKILELNPNFIVANDEENKKGHVEELREKSKAHIEVTEVATIEDALVTIHELAMHLGAEQRAAKLTENISLKLDQRPDEPPLRTAYFIWKEPWMTVGGDTYIHDVLRHWRLQNVFGHRERYPKIDLQQLAERNPELVLLSSEPYPFKEKHIAEVEEACPNARVLLVDGEWFSWYGSRMQHAFDRLNTWRKAIS
jgi:ABC-type Fe3+-hydroxamate transport system substrate-binding protein